MVLHGPLRVRLVREAMETAFASAAYPVGGDREERKPVTGIGGGYLSSMCEWCCWLGSMPAARALGEGFLNP